MHNTGYVLRFTLIMCAVSALILSGMFYATEPIAAKAEAVFNKRQILAAVQDYLPKSLEDMSDEEVLNLFQEKIDQKVLDMSGQEVPDIAAENVDMAKERKKPEQDRILPLFTYEAPDGEKFYILTVRGTGLWDEIWGNIALKDDWTTIAGASFDHKAETPGLGAEIKDNPAFPAQFRNKRIFNADGDFTGVAVKKGDQDENPHAVDAISGATVTGNGVTEMMFRGLRYYLPYIERLKPVTVDDLQKK